MWLFFKMTLLQFFNATKQQAGGKIKNEKTINFGCAEKQRKYLYVIRSETQNRKWNLNGRPAGDWAWK